MTSSAFIGWAMSAVAVTSALVPTETASFVVTGAMGVGAGTLWRMRYWFTPEGIQYRTCIADISASGALIMLTYGICDHFNLTNWSAGLVGVMAAIVGVEPIRKTAIFLMDQWAKTWAGRQRNDGDPA